MKDDSIHQGLSATEFTNPSGTTHRAVWLNEHNSTWLVRGRFAVDIGSWTPLASDLQRAAFACIYFAPSGRAGSSILYAFFKKLKRESASR